jgi:hypothetical protein
MRILACCAAAACMTLPLLFSPIAHARGEGDTHIDDVGREQTLDCGGGTLFINGSANVITALGTCYAVTMQGSDNLVIADTVTDDITVYGWNQTVIYRGGDPYVLDRGRELGMTNRISRAPA